MPCQIYVLEAKAEITAGFRQKPTENLLEPARNKSFYKKSLSENTTP